MDADRESTKAERWGAPPSRATAAGLGALAGALLGGPVGSVIGAAGAQLAVDVTSELWNTHSKVRQRQAVVPLAYAAQVSGTPIERLSEQISSDPDLLALFRIVTQQAADTRLEAKLLALGRILANVLADSAQLDLDYTVADALSVVEPPHLKVLAYLDQWSGQTGQAINIYAIHQALPELGLGLRPILSALQTKALILERVEYGQPNQAPRIGIQSGTGPVTSVAELRRLWMITQFGRDVLARITTAAEEATELTVADL